MADERPPCVYPDRALTLQDLLDTPADCQIPVGVSFSASMVSTETVPAPPEKKMPVKKTVQEMVPPAAPAVDSPASELVASVGVPQTAMSEINSIVGKDVSSAQVVMAVVAVAGGGAAIKVYQSLIKGRSAKLEQQHELEMRKLELQAQAQQGQQQQQNNDQHQACTASRLALEARLTAAEAKLAAVESRASKGGGLGIELDGFDPEELEERVKKLEVLLKKGKR